MTPTDLYRWANLLLVIGHAAPTAAIAWHVWRRRDARTTWLWLPLGLFFLTGAWMHGLNVAHADDSARHWGTGVAHLVRAVVVGGIAILMLPRGLQYFAELPTRAEYRRALAQKDHAIRAAEDAERVSMALAEKLGEKNEKLSGELDLLRAHFEHLRHRQVTEAEYQELRKHLHAIRDAAAGGKSP